MKLMSIDYGEKRVGIASTDESGEFALPRMVLENNSELLEKILAFKKEEGIEKVIIGESRNFKGEANPVLAKAEELKTTLESLGIEVIFHPEVLTTMEARQIQGNTNMTDASAAALILKSYLDFKKAS
jgi:putative holliday junction resolvase